MAKPGDVTLATYEQAWEIYVRQSEAPRGALLKYLDQVATLVDGGTVLEIGSGPGWDADHLEARGARVLRTDATDAFVQRLRELGRHATRLDARDGDLGGSHDAIVANAVLLHLSREEFGEFLHRARLAVADGGILAFTLKEGDGDAWSDQRLGLPRHFTYWREEAIREQLRSSRWEVLLLEHATGQVDDWLFVIAR